MKIFDEIIVNVTFTLFPILIYMIYSSYKNDKIKKEDNIYFFIALVSSIYLCFKYGPTGINGMSLLFCNIPIVVAYIRKKEKFGIILSIFIIIYSSIILKNNFEILIIKYILYFIVYKVNNKKHGNDRDLINTIAVIQAFILSFEYFYNCQKVNNVGEIFNMIIVAVIFYSVSFLVLHLLNINNEINNLYKVKQDLEKEKDIKNALFKLTHEIKNPLAVCKGYLDMFNYNDQKKILKYTTIMKEEINRSLNIMNDFVELNKIQINKELIDINMIVEEVYESIQLLIKNKNINIKYKMINKEILMEGDYNRLKQVLINILKNSVESISNAGYINIKLKTIGNYIHIIIKDNGIGMTEEELSKVKDIFWTTKKQGSGIGVALSNEIIKGHNGELNYYSVKDKGTIVNIVLPLN